MTDTDRMKFLAGCGSDDGPVIEGFVNVLEDYWECLATVCCTRVGIKAYVQDDFEESDEDKLKAFRSLVDAAIITNTNRRSPNG